MERIAISKFKATCLAVMERVRRSGQPVLVVRRGEPVAQVIPPSPSAANPAWLGSARDSARIEGDLVEPVLDAAEWEVLAP